MPHARAVARERQVGAALVGRDGLVLDREVPHVQLVDRPVDVLLDHGRGRVRPQGGLRARVGQVDDDRVGRVRRERDRVRVRHGVLDDRAGRRRVHGDRVPVGGTRPAGLARDAPHAVRAALGLDALRRARRRTGPQQQVHVLGGGRPQRERRDVAVPRDAQLGILRRVGVQVVDDARDLHPGEGDRAGVGRGQDPQLALQERGGVRGADAQRGVACQRGERRRDVRRQARRVVGQRHGDAARDLAVDELKTARRRLVQRERQAGRIGVHQVARPGERVGAHPVRAGLSRPRQGRVLTVTVSTFVAESNENCTCLPSVAENAMLSPPGTPPAPQLRVRTGPG